MNVPQTTTPATAPEIGMRILYMLLFAVVFWILCWTLAVATLVQLVLRLLSGRPNAELSRFGAALGAYARQGRNSARISRHADCSASASAKSR